ncbi:GNAT family N-acetyltransferase [Nocardioides cynanchi]|uniref:GNAT family N-acetyltransferase n=1 Tax=Nocardioides cynanchi TaxID=2558918 RepID=UPI00192D7E03|nr:GNAT family protein [Nocardioides cynanchi]
MSLDRISWPLRTDRLSIRPATVEDLDALGRIQNLPEVAAWLPSSAGTQDDYLLRMGRHSLLAQTLAVELDSVIIGELYVHIRSGWAQREVADAARDCEAEIGWGFDPAHHGRGYATEATTELVRSCFEDLGLRRITAEAFADNAASLRIMDRLGMRRETLGVRTTLHRSGSWADSVVYALLADEWRAAGRPVAGGAA